jgi:hypothetical protein
MKKQRHDSVENAVLDVFLSEFSGNGKKRGERGPGAKSLALLEKAVRIVEQYRPITVRGVSYKLFVEEAIASMAKNETQKVGRLLVYAREHDLIDWDAVVDESRQVERLASWDNLSDFAGALQRSYRRDFWSGQPYHVQVWSEKSTVGGVIRPVTETLGVPFMAVHGFGSATVVHDVAEASARDRRDLVILYVGDHDPSGMHMSEVDLPSRIDRYGGRVTIHRIALCEQDLISLPSFKAKPSDPRYRWYRSQYTDKAWELDAMDPNELRARVETMIRSYIDEDAWKRMRVVEDAEQQTVHRVAAAMAGGSF